MVCKSADAIVIFDQQDGFGAELCRVPCWQVQRPLFSVRFLKMEGEPWSRSSSVSTLTNPFSCWNRPVDAAETQSSPFPDFFRGEERIEGPRLRVLVHPDARISDPECYVTSWWRSHRGQVRELVWQNFDVLRLNEQPAAAGHGITGIRGEIEQNLFELHRIALDWREIWGQLGFDGDVYSDDPLEELTGFLNHGARPFPAGRDSSSVDRRAVPIRG